MANKKVAFTLTAVNKTKAAFDAVTKSLTKVGKLGKNTAMGVGKVGLAATGAATALGAFVKVNTDAIDRLGKTASKLGINVDLLQQMRFAADQTGIAQNTLDMALQRFIRRVGEAQNGTGEAKAALEELGIQLKNNDGTLRSTQEVLFDVADGIKNTEDASTRLRLAFKFFDSEGAALVNTLKGGSAGLQDFFQEAQDLGIIIDAETTAAFEKFGDTTSMAFKQIKTFSQYIIAAFLPVLQTLAERFIEMMKHTAKLAGGFKQLGKDIAVSMVNGLEKAVVAMANFSNSTLELFNAFGWFDGAIVDVDKLKQKFENIRTAITEVKEPLKEVNEEIDTTVNNTKKLSLMDLITGRDPNDPAGEGESGFKALAPFEKFLKSAEDGYSDFITKIKTMQEEMQSIFQKSYDGLTNLTMDFLEKGKASFKDFATSIVR